MFLLDVVILGCMCTSGIFTFIVRVCVFGICCHCVLVSGPRGELRTVVPCCDTVLKRPKLSDSLCKLLSPWLPFTVIFSHI